jgi:gamma-glutamyltranspeptidase/glutathione hydrolase
MAERGVPVHERLAFDIAIVEEKISRDPVLAELFLPQRRPIRPGETYRNHRLASTLRAVAQNGADAFYRGPIARAIVASLQAWGGAHTEEDFSDHRGEFVEPISAPYRGYTVYECPPNGQGIVSLMLLRILEQLRIDREGPLGRWRYHALMEAARLGFAFRDRYLGDRVCGGPDFTQLLTDSFAYEQSRRIAPDARLCDDFAIDWPDHRDTIFVAVVDEQRNAFSLINSLFDSFGSGRVDAETGICLHSRGRAFSLKEGHPNCAAPGKRPMHTLIPGLLAKDGRAVMPFGVMGGHFQPVGHAHLLSSILDYDLGLQEAIDLPRCFPQNGKIWAESSLPLSIRDHLASLGHVLAERVEPVGGTQLIWIDEQSGVLAGASDPRKDGCAMGF